MIYRNNDPMAVIAMEKAHYGYDYDDADICPFCRGRDTLFYNGDDTYICSNCKELVTEQDIEDMEEFDINDYWED